MRNLSFLLGILLLVDDVFCADEVKSALIGETVTLYIDDTETEKADNLNWKIQGENKFIAQFDRETDKVLINGKERFGDRLQLDKKTGSLTIKNIATTDSGVYQLEIKSKDDIKVKTFHVTVSEVSAVSVMVGDSVTLRTDLTQIQSDEEIEWKLQKEKQNIEISTNDKRFSGRLQLDNKTGSLTIKNIATTDSEVYQLEIISSMRVKMKKIFNVTVNGEMKTVSVMEGEPSILYTGLIKIQKYDLILWKYEYHLIAEIDKVANKFLTPDNNAGGKFKGRLQLHQESGDLTVRGSRSTDSGVYHLQMNSSSHSLHRSISVTVSVPDKPTPYPGLSYSAVAGIVLVQLVVFAAVIFAGVIYHFYKISKTKRLGDEEKNGTNDPLKPETANNDAL